MFKTQNVFISIVLNTSFAKCYEIFNVFSFVSLSGLNFVCCFCLVGYPGPMFLRCAKILSHHHYFVSFLPSFFLPCKNTFMDDYDGILNYNCLKYNPSKIFDNFWFIIFYGDQNIGWKRIAIRTRWSFSSYVVHLKGFSPIYEGPMWNII